MLSGKIPLLEAISSTHFAAPFGLLSLGLLINMLLAVLLGRVAAVVLLLERDEILANSIREACAQAKAAAGGGGEGAGGGGSMDTDKTVVAVLGLAHCKGVAKRLTEG